jgi:hypothetical protein
MLQDLVGAVPVVLITVENDDPFSTAFSQHGQCGHGEPVEGAVPTAAIPT